jgi:primase-polymerase (primpol)-like protein
MPHNSSIHQHDPSEQSAGQSRPPKPSALRVIPEAIPPELKARKQWVIWRYAWLPDKQKWDKPLLQSHNGNLATHSSPKTWSDFDAAMRAYHFEGANLDGIGFVFDKDNGLVGIDLDHCRDPQTGTVEPWAQAIIDQFDTYTEISTSGTGVHLIAHGTLPGRGVKTVVSTFAPQWWVAEVDRSWLGYAAAISSIN